jgi:olefin beta-lactone synthetase
VTLSNETIVNVSTGMTETAKKDPYKKAVVYPESRSQNGRLTYSHFTFRQLEQESDCMAAGLESAGVVRNTKTILMMKPCLDFFSLAFALLKIGAIPVLVDPGMGITPLLRCVKQIKPEAFIGVPWTRLLKLFRPDLFNRVKTFITTGQRLFWGGMTLEDIRKVPWITPVIADTQADDTAAILFTPGNTEPAKAVIYTHGNLIAQFRQIKDQFDISSDEIDLTTLSSFALLGPVLGITSVIPDIDTAHPALANPQSIIETIFDQGVTNIIASPALLDLVGRYGQNNRMTLPSLKRVISVGAPFPPSQVERFTKMLSGNAEVHTAYGSTEAMPILSIGSNEILSETKGLSEKGYGNCIGRPIKDIDVRLIQITDSPVSIFSDDLLLPHGEIGEFIVKGDLVSGNYLENSEQDILQKIKENSETWHRMDDLGWMDKNNRYWFCGRKSHRVITEHGTYYSIPCEAIFNTHPDVYRSALVGIGTEENQTPVICIELEESRNLEQNRIEMELLALAEKNVITQNIKTILFHKAFPVDDLHHTKIIREELAVWAEEQLAS